VAVFLVFMVGILLSGILPWSPLNCRHEEIDIQSGRVRHTRYLLYCEIGNRVEDTWLSRSVDSTDEPFDWHRVNTFSPGWRYSPHYRYHAALHQVKTLELIDQTIPLEPAARRQVAQRILHIWQTKGSSRAANAYVNDVCDSALTLEEQGAAQVRAADLPVP